MLQTIIVILILALVVFIVSKRVLKLFRPPTPGEDSCASGCDGCTEDCQLKDFQKPQNPDDIQGE